MLQWAFFTMGLALTSFLTGGFIGKMSLSFFPQRVYQLFALCGGILVGLIYELIIQTVNEYNETSLGLILGGVIGICLMFFLESLFHNKKMDKGELNLQSSLILTIAIGFHNLPAGMSLGANFLKGNHDLAFSMLGVLFFHILPEGIALVIPFLLAGRSFIKFGGPAFILAFILGLGTFIGLTVDNESLRFNSLLMGIAIGSILYVTFFEIILKAFKKLLFTKFLFNLLLGSTIIVIYLNFI